MHLYLFGKLFRIGERCQRMGICLSQEFYLPCIGKALQQVDHFRNILFKLLNGHTCDRHRATERTV